MPNPRVMPAFEFVDAPPPEPQRTAEPRGDVQYDWRALSGFLLAYPGEWVRIDVTLGGNAGPWVVAKRLRDQGLEAVVRFGDLYLRWPAEEDADA